MKKRVFLPFFSEISKYIPELDKKFEYIFVDDGSADSSLSILKEFEKQDTAVRVYSLRKNLGKAEALTLGFQMAKGERIVTLDADLQDQPSEIKKLLEKQEEGVDLVCGWRKNRKDTSKMKIISKMFNAVARKVFDVSVHDYNCGLKLYTAEAAQTLRLYGGMHRFIPVLIAQEGFVVDEVAVHHEPRKFGKSKYSFSKIWKDLPDMFTMLFLAKYTKRPLHFFWYTGGGLFLIGVFILLYLSILHFMGVAIGRRPLLFFGGVIVLSGLQLFFTGFLAELITNLSSKDAMHFLLKYKSKEA